jgi:saccharopine dehydrogenase-like NADP-dependent oxidoreductase
MIASDEVKTKGVVPPELALDAKRFFKELEKRGMKVVTRTEEM